MPIDRDRRVKYDPDKIKPDEMSPDEKRLRSKRGRSLVSQWQADFYARGTGEIGALAKLVLSAISPEDSKDEIDQLPSDMIRNIGERSSLKPVFITNTPYRPKPGDV